MTEQNTGGLSRDKKVLLALAAIFFIPLMVAWIWFYNVDAFRPGGSVANGDLIQPVRVLGEFSFPRIDVDGEVTDASLHGRWAMVYVGGPVCEEDCRQSLYEMRQVHTALGRDAVRMQRVSLMVGASKLADSAFFQAEHPGLIMASVASTAPILENFDQPGRIYLVDPLGNLMMSYPADASGRDLLDDLKRLFRVSRIG